MRTGKIRSNPDTQSRVAKRLHLLDDLIKARGFADQNHADKALVEANRWLRRHPFDVRVIEARDRLRESHPVDLNDTNAGNGI